MQWLLEEIHPQHMVFLFDTGKACQPAAKHISMQAILQRLALTCWLWSITSCEQAMMLFIRAANNKDQHACSLHGEACFKIGTAFGSTSVHQLEALTNACFQMADSLS